ncbi:hypothetical protein FACS1894110_09790 [Spirochaetia bacterium]|nr:hypothetical protein FACS1894110_09790 [Spirochaetia bacterium]
MSYQGDKFTEIADVLRDKYNLTTPIVANDFAAMIAGLTSPAGTPHVLEYTRQLNTAANYLDNVVGVGSGNPSVQSGGPGAANGVSAKIASETGIIFDNLYTQANLPMPIQQLRYTDLDNLSAPVVKAFICIVVSTANPANNTYQVLDEWYNPLVLTAGHHYKLTIPYSLVMFLSGTISANGSSSFSNLMFGFTSDVTADVLPATYVPLFSNANADTATYKNEVVNIQLDSIDTGIYNFIQVGAKHLYGTATLIQGINKGYAIRFDQGMWDIQAVG